MSKNLKSRVRELKGRKNNLEKSGGGAKGRAQPGLDHIFSPPCYLKERREQERSTQTGQQRPEHSEPSYHSLTAAPSPISITHLFSHSFWSFCSTDPPFFPSPTPDNYRLSFPINHAAWQLISTRFDSFRSCSSHKCPAAEDQYPRGVLGKIFWQRGSDVCEPHTLDQRKQMCNITHSS